MSIWDIFRKKKIPPGDPATQKAGLRLVNKNAEAAARFAAADELAQIGTSEAVGCLLQRFTVVIGGPTPDEDEKKYVRNIVVKAGSTAVEPLMAFLGNNEIVGQALEILQEITSPKNYLDRLLQLTKSFDPFYSKYPDKKIQVLQEIGRFEDTRIVTVMTPFLEDTDDDVRLAALAAISRQEEDSAREQVVRMIVESYESPRLRIAACEIVSEKNWSVKGYRKQVESILPDTFLLNKKGQIIKR
ncbi:MAG: HEAT repeat domain-containing protein [bacterium]